MIELRRASRWYGQVIGLNDVTCTLGPGVTALLGPNGAGKSTFMRLVSGQLRPTTGQVLVDGLAPFANTRVYERLGYCPEGDSFYEDMTGRQFVSALATLAGLGPKERERRVEGVLDRVGMTPHVDRKIAGYSKGMRQRIKLAQALVHDPQVLLLDEPLNGLDPGGRREITDLTRQLGEEGRCVVISSHILHEVELVTRNILLVHRGRVLAQGDVYEIRGLIDRHPHRVLFSADRPRELGQALLGLPAVLSLRLDAQHPDRLEIETRDPEAFYARLADVVLDGGYQVYGIESPDNNLEAVFRYLTEG
ncbi:MAG: ABC transporter ATP-binding protein [Armatimonadetes bacterium]|nr:ABC transporter ATP-binding protein [Armatimonadota bacterium]